MEGAFAAYGGDADTVSIAANARDDAVDQMFGLWVVGLTEAQGIHIGYGTRAHGEDVAKDAPHARRRALIGLDVGGVVVAFHFKHDGLAVADVYDARVLAWAANHPRRLRWQRL